MDHLEGHDQVVGTGCDCCRQLPCDIDDFESGPFPDTGFGGVLARCGDGGVVVVVSVDADLGERLGQRDRRPTLSAADLRRAGTRCLETLGEAGDL